MEASILIVTKNRKEELQKTLEKLVPIINFNKHEIIVFFDGPTEGSEELKKMFPYVIWQSSKYSLGASKARSILYKAAKGDFLFGFDDDAHPLEEDFIERTILMFRSNSEVGLIAFREIKGQFLNDYIPEYLLFTERDYITKDFVGCGFAIKKDVYFKTRGFPKWIDIYGEEICLALEVIDRGYNLKYTYQVSVNHRVDKEERKRSGANYFRFRKQLTNTTYFYLVYYPFPLLFYKIIRLYFLNFRKYSFKDRGYFVAFFNSGIDIFKNFYRVLKFREPVSKGTLEKFNSLKNPIY